MTHFMEATVSGKPSSGERTPLTALLQGPLPERNTPEAARLHGVALARIASVDADGVSIHLPLRGETPVPAASLCALTEAATGRECAVLFLEGDPNRPLIIGLLLETTGTEKGESDGLREIRADDERIVIEAERELELRCGEAVMLLRRNGEIHLRGTYITSQASATQRIRGGSVHVN